METVAPRIRRITFRNVHGFLVILNGKAMLVDTGYSGMLGEIEAALEKEGLGLEDIALVLLTHTHFDHAGGAAEIRRLTRAPLLVHESESHFLASGRTPIPYGTRWKGKVISWVGRHFASKIEKYPPVEADVLLGEEYTLDAYGFPGKIIHTPGHTPGSVSFIVDEEKALVGDTMMGISLKEHFPPFAMDQRAVLESWRKLLGTSCTYFFPAHGGRIDRKEIENELPSASLRYGR